MSSSRQSNVVIGCLLLVAATLAFYNPVIHNQFTGFDDWSYILKNPQVQSGLTWSTVKWSFTTFREGNWHPLTWMSHALDCQLFRLNPVGHHYTNLLLHSLNAVLVFLLLRRATGMEWASLMVAALFALHPVNVESVAWASERKNVLSMLFFLLAMLTYDRYARAGKRSLYVWVVILFALGLMAKPQVVTLPFVLLLWDYWPLQRMFAPTKAGDSGGVGASAPRSFGYLVWEKLPLFILAAADSVITAIAQRTGNAVRTLSEVSISERIANIFVSYVKYIAMAFWPARLAPMYPRPMNGLPMWQVGGSAVVLLAVSALVWRWRDRRYLLVGWCWFLGTLVPMIGIMTVGDQSMADRYAYLPYIGLFIAVVWTLEAFASEHRIRTVWCGAPAVAVLLAFGALTYRQIGYWHDDETLWHYTLRVTDGNYVAHNNLALMLAGENRSDEAVAEFRAAKALHKYPPDQVLKLAYYELRVGHPQEAAQESESVLHSSSDPKIESVAWSLMGQSQLDLHHPELAGESYQKALQLNPENGIALVGSGILALRDGRPEKAETQIAHALQFDPSAVNFLLLSEALRREGRTAEAEAATAQAQKISPDLSEARNAAGRFLTVAGVTPL
jgi:tetratricopeptide (TPR) repeat protein